MKKQRGRPIMAAIFGFIAGFFASISLLAFGIILSFNGQPFEALEEYDKVLASPPGTISGTLGARTRLRRGVALEELGRPEEAMAELEGVLTKALDLDDPVLLAQAHRALVLLNIWTGRGALVLRVNYRGSAGYGEAFRTLNVRNLGVGDAWDVLSGV